MTRHFFPQVRSRIPRFEDHVAGDACEVCRATGPVNSTGAPGDPRGPWICRTCWPMVSDPLGTAVALVALRDHVSMLAARIASLERRVRR